MPGSTWSLWALFIASKNGRLKPVEDNFFMAFGPEIRLMRRKSYEQIKNIEKRYHKPKEERIRIDQLRYRDLRT